MNLLIMEFFQKILINAGKSRFLTNADTSEITSEKKNMKIIYWKMLLNSIREHH